jgi:hypothetical protein
VLLSIAAGALTIGIERPGLTKSGLWSAPQEATGAMICLFET